MIGREVLEPEVASFMIRLESLRRIAFEPGGVETGGIDPEHVGQERPGPVDRFGLEVITERPVPQHFKEGVVIRVVSHVFEIIVLPTSSNALLRVDRSGVRPVALSEEDILELVHSGVGEQEGGVVVGNGRARRNDLVRGALGEEIKELLSDLRGGRGWHAEFRTKAVWKNATV